MFPQYAARPRRAPAVGYTSTPPARQRTEATSNTAPRRPPQQRDPIAPDDYKVLPSMVMNDQATAEGLIAFEQRKAPTAERAVLITKAIERLREDRRWQG